MFLFNTTQFVFNIFTTSVYSKINFLHSLYMNLTLHICQVSDWSTIIITSSLAYNISLAFCTVNTNVRIGQDDA